MNAREIDATFHGWAGRTSRRTTTHRPSEGRGLVVAAPAFAGFLPAMLGLAIALVVATAAVAAQAAGGVTAVTALPEGELVRLAANEEQKASDDDELLDELSQDRF